MENLKGQCQEIVNPGGGLMNQFPQGTGTKFLITKFLITKFLITKFLITKFLSNKVPKQQSS